MNSRNHYAALMCVLIAIPSSSSLVFAQHDPWSFILPEQRRVEVRQPGQIPHALLPAVDAPVTIANLPEDRPQRPISLTEAMNIGLSNMDVVRVLGGVVANSSGRTIYDVAIANTRVDQQRGAFDPTLNLNNGWNQSDSPSAIFDPTDPTRSIITGGRADGYNFDLGLAKRTLTGGIIDFGVNANDSRFSPGIFPLDPQLRSSVDLSYTQPLLQGGGATVARIPIVLARIDTERSYFQLKDVVQSHVQGIIEAYWSLVFARTDLWARQQQVEQLGFAFDLTNARFEVGDANRGDLAQTQVAYENFRANLVSTRANLLLREAALRNLLGLPPEESVELVPVSSLIGEKVPIDWQNTIQLAETYRPDIIELKLILEADQERLLLSRNQALPRLDGVALYRWNGLEGEMPNGANLSSQPGQFADWNLGVNFSVPLGLRAERAALRQQELVLRRDQVNLQQGLHQAAHQLVLTVRNLDQFHEQYLRFQEVRKAAKINLDQQAAQYREGLIQFIIVLQAITDWGNAVSNEAQSLVLYNTELARLEAQTGTILETHGIAFFEERFGSIGPLGRLAEYQCYPETTRPTQAGPRYPAGEKPSEEYFDLSDPLAGEDANVDNEPEQVDAPTAEGEGSSDADGVDAVDSSLDQEASLGNGGRKKTGFWQAPVRAAQSLRGLFR